MRNQKDRYDERCQGGASPSHDSITSHADSAVITPSEVWNGLDRGSQESALYLLTKLAYKLITAPPRIGANEGEDGSPVDKK